MLHNVVHFFPIVLLSNLHSELHNLLLLHANKLDAITSPKLVYVFARCYNLISCYYSRDSFLKKENSLGNIPAEIIKFN